MKQEKPKVTRIAAYGLIFKDRKILLCRISEQLPDLSGQWTLPGGGLDFGEEPVAAMVREVREESGLAVRSTKLAGVDSLSVEGPHRYFHAIRIVYFAERTGGTLTNEIDGSTDRCDWWSLEDARRLPLVDLAKAGLKMAFPEELGDT